jgi:hypothetical protein
MKSYIFIYEVQYYSLRPIKDVFNLSKFEFLVSSYIQIYTRE